MGANVKKMVDKARNNLLPDAIWQVVSRAQESNKLEKFLDFAGLLDTKDQAERKDVLDLLYSMVVFSLIPSGENEPIPNPVEEIFSESLRAKELIDTRTGEVVPYAGVLEKCLLHIGFAMKQCLEIAKIDNGYLYEDIGEPAWDLLRVTGLGDVLMAISDTLAVIEQSIQDQEQEQDNEPIAVDFNFKQ